MSRLVKVLREFFRSMLFLLLAAIIVAVEWLRADIA